MANGNGSTSEKIRGSLAYVILVVTIIVIGLLAWYTIKTEPTEARNIFNVVLPVFASWVGTVLAFYFGRENFESASREVQRMAQQRTPEQRAREPVSKHMRPLVSIACFQIPTGKTDADFVLSDLRAKFGGNINRMPVIDENKHPKYMIHESRIIKYIDAGGQNTDTLEVFINAQKNKGIEYGLNKGFVVVSEQTAIGEAKHKMEGSPSCLDIFVTQGGTEKEPLTGWISNTRMSRLFEA